MAISIDPGRIRPVAGVILVEVVEVLGGYTKGGLFIPGTLVDHGGKDTCLVKVIKKGPPPMKRYSAIGGGGIEVRDCAPWPEVMTDQIKVGDVLLMPRDVPLVFVWDEKRFALVNEHEAIVAMDAADFEAGSFEKEIWDEGVIGDQFFPVGANGP